MILFSSNTGKAATGGAAFFFILTQPHFDASEFAFECYLKDVFYVEDQK